MPAGQSMPRGGSACLLSRENVQSRRLLCDFTWVRAKVSERRHLRRWEGLPEAEVQNDGHEHVHGFATASAGVESPLFHRQYSLQIQTQRV
jgi:hypothetical protein